MIRRSMLGLFGGVLLTAVLSSGSTAQAGCGGRCSDMIGMQYVYVGCAIYYNGVDQEIGSTCYYIERGPTPAPAQGQLIAE